MQDINGITQALMVSIPGGFFRGLQRDYGFDGQIGLEEFQSLAGFFVACNDPEAG